MGFYKIFCPISISPQQIEDYAIKLTKQCKPSDKTIYWIDTDKNADKQ
jgi:hypothetical protein